MQRWEYKHLFIKACDAKEPTGFLAESTHPEVGLYPFSEVESQLAKMGQEGWDLISMEPEWFWERVGVSLATEITRPKVIIGWYCTFKRPTS